MNENIKTTWENAITDYNISVNSNNINLGGLDLYDRIEKLEKIVKKMEEFLNKFFDTEINRK